MKFTDTVGQAFRNIGRQKLRSALTIFAVTIGATSVTIMLALVTGAKDFFIKQFESTGQLQQVIVSQQTDLDFERAQHSGSNCNDCIKLTDKIVDQIKTYPHVVSVARTTMPYAFESVEFGGKKLAVQGVNAYDPNGTIQHQFVGGKDFSPTDGAGKIIIGTKYAEKWGFKGKYDDAIGKELTLTTQSFFTGEGATLLDPVAEWKRCQSGGCNSDTQPPRPPATIFKATVVGVVADEEESLLFPMNWAKGLMKNQRYDQTKEDQEANNRAMDAWQRSGGRGPRPTPHFTLKVEDMLATSGYTSLIVKVDQTSNAEAVAAQIKKLGVGAVTAQSFIQQQLQIFNILSLVLGGIGGIALFVAAIGVINTMVMAILERTREIGVLRACGATRATIRGMFTIEAATLGFLGGVTGVVSGWGLSLVANQIINKQLIGQSIKVQNIINLPLWLILSVIGIATLIGVLAGLYPAFRASRLNPIDALRYE